MLRPESHLAVVGHSSFLYYMFSAFGHAAAPAVQQSLHKWYSRPAAAQNRCRSVLPCAGFAAPAPAAVGAAARLDALAARAAAPRRCCFHSSGLCLKLTLLLPNCVRTCRYDNCEMRTVVLADEGGTHSHDDPLHFHGGHSVGAAKADGSVA